MKLNLRTSFICLLIALLIPFDYALSAPAGADHHGSFWDLKYYIINFSIYSLLIYYIWRKTVPGLWAARRERIESSINKARKKIMGLDDAISQAKQKLSEIPAEAERIKRAVAQEAALEADEIRKQALATASRIKKQSVDKIASERKGLEEIIRKRYVDLALKLAEQKLIDALNTESDKVYRDKTLKNLKGLIQ